MVLFRDMTILPVSLIDSTMKCSQKTSGFLVFSEGIKKDQGLQLYYKRGSGTGVFL